MLVDLGRPHLFYYDSTAGNLRHAWWSGSRWRLGTMDGAGPGRRGQLAGDIGSNLSAVTRDGRTDVFSYDITRGDLRLAHYDRVRAPYWTFRSLHAPGLQPPNRYRAATAAVAAPYPWVFYYDTFGYGVRYGRYDPGTRHWHYSLMGTGPWSGRDIGATRSEHGIFVYYASPGYYAAGVLGVIRYAWRRLA